MSATNTSDIRASLPLTWSSKYTIGIAAVDSEHLKLISLMNDLRGEMAHGRGRAKLQEIFEGLSTYTVQHFSNEEALMRANSYPAYAEHKATHERLIAQLKSLQSQFRAGTATVTLDVLEFLQNWLISHILGDDKNYVPHLKAAGCR